MTASSSERISPNMFSEDDAELGGVLDKLHGGVVHACGRGRFRGFCGDFFGDEASPEYGGFETLALSTEQMRRPRAWR